MAPENSDRRSIITEALRRIDDLSAKLAIAESSETEPIAVIGLGCRLPGGVSTADDYWDLLTEGRSGVVRVPANRWDADEYYSEDYTEPGTIVNRVGGFLTHWDPDQFDAEFFGLSPREAVGMDPQQRLLMEVAWEALENAGLTPAHIRGTQTGIFVGMTTNDYSLTFAGKLPPADLDPYIPFGNASNFAAGRLSYFLGANGPAVVVDSACSSSLVSIHLAAQSLRRRESDTALAAGVNLNLSPENSIACSRWGMLAPDGTCKTFDAAANGYVRSEGCGVVVLKRLSDAQRDGDRILAVIRGTGVNQDGASSGQTVPNGPAQQALMRRVLRNARLQPSEVDYVEAHGTGTPLGDPIELDALHNVYGDRGDASPLILGSVKTNLGHLESASGVAGFIKAVLAVRHAHIPRQLYFSELNPHACAGAGEFTIASDPLDWPETGRPRRAGISSFGVSGTNAHIVIEQAPHSAAAEPLPTAPQPAVTTLVLSAKSSARVASQAESLADWLEGPGAAVTLWSVADTLTHHRARFGVRASVTATDTAQAVAGLRALAGDYRAPGVVAPRSVTSSSTTPSGTTRAGTVFVYSGQGSQWAGMGRRLLAQDPAFAAAVDELEPDFVAQVGFSLRDTLVAGDEVTGIDRIQPVLVGIQLALTAAWRAHGVTPDAVIGHSMGEVAAAVTAGALTAAEGFTVIATRSRLMKSLSGQGAMALLGIDAAAAEALIADFSDLTVAVYASPQQTVIAGPPEQVDAAVARVAADEHLARRVEVDVASHHPIIDPILPELRAALAGLHPTTPTIPLLSTAAPDGAVSPLMDAEYWCANLRNPVRFGAAVARAGTDHGTFIEMSPHPLLTHALDDALADVNHRSLGTLSRDTDDLVTFHTNLAAVGVWPATPDSTDPTAVAPFTPIPNTPWHHQRYWVTVPESAAVATGTSTAPAPAPKPAPAGGHGVLDDWYLELAWVDSVHASSDIADSPVVVVVDDDTAGQASADRLTAAFGAGSQVISTVSADALPAALAGAADIVYLPSPHRDTDAAARAHEVFATARGLAATLAALPEPGRLTIVTRNAQPVSDDESGDPAPAILWGFGRTLALENPELWGGLIDVDAAVPAEILARHVRAEIAERTGPGPVDDQVAYRRGRRLVPRLRHASPPAPLTRLPRATSHLVVGATGNVGPDLIRALAELGADTVVAVSRDPGDSLTALTAELAAHGTTLVVHAADAADPAAMAGLFARFGVDLPPLDGVYLAALSGGAGNLVDLSDAEVAAMFRPKVDAVSVIHELTLTMPIRRFVLFSSVTGLFGSRWLGHYTAANSYADTLAYARRAMGLPATVIDWGLWKSWADAQPETASAGLTPMPNEVAIGLLPTLLSPDAPLRPVVVAADWERLADAYRMRTSFRIVDDLLGSTDATDLAALPTAANGTLLGNRGATSTPTWLARLDPGELPYPGSHLVQNAQVVPASVLLATLAEVALQLGAPGIADIVFSYPLLAGRPLAIRVTVAEPSSDGARSVTISSSTSPSAAPDRWVDHVEAVVPAAVPPTPEYEAVEVNGFALSEALELEQRWGLSGRPYQWEISDPSCAGGRLLAHVHHPDGGTAPVLDAAIHLARLVNGTFPDLMFPASVDVLTLTHGFTDPDASVSALHRGQDDAGFTVDATVTGDSGIIEVRGLRFAHAAAAPALDSPDDAGAAPDSPDWSTRTADETRAELHTRLSAILARELGMPVQAIRIDQPFPELGLDSMMAMATLRDARRLVDLELSATMLWNHPTIESLADLLTDMLAPRREAAADTADEPDETTDGLLDSLFDSVESLEDPVEPPEGSVGSVADPNESQPNPTVMDESVTVASESGNR